MNIQKFGFEREYFVKSADGKEYVEVPTPLLRFRDECYYLIEARSEPHTDPEKGIALMEVEERRLHGAAFAAGVTASLQANAPDFPPKLRRALHRAHGKQAAHSMFLYGKSYSSSMARAGLHIHFGFARDIRDKDGKIIETVLDLCDMPEIVRRMDEAFRVQIRAARRVPGEYEVKGHGFEYQSLPANMPLATILPTLVALKAA
jgi:hypothetical protein